MYTNGKLPTLNAAGDPPLLFVTSPSMLNAAQENGQHQQYRGISVGTVGVVPILPPAGVTFQPLAGMGNYSGAPFGFVFESTSSLWLADAGPGAQGGPGWPGVTGGSCSIGTCPPPIALGQWAKGSEPAGLWDKYSCTIQHWTSTADIISGTWSWKESVIVDWGMPCYALTGRVENGVLALYTSTSGNDYSGKQPGTGYPGNGGYKLGSSKVYKVNTATKAVSVVVTAQTNTVYRAVAIPPQQRGNYTCPQGYYGTTYDLTCSYDCCTKCTPTCPAGLVLVPTCSWAADNLCLAPSTFQTLANVLTGSTTNTVPGAMTLAGLDTTTLSSAAAVQVVSNSITVALQASIAKATGAAAPVVQVKVTSIVDAASGVKFYSGSRRLEAAAARRLVSATATVNYAVTCGSASTVALAQAAVNDPAVGASTVAALPAQAALAGVSAALFSKASAQVVQTSFSAASSGSSSSSSSGNGALGALVLLLLPVGAAAYYFYSKKEEAPKALSSASTPNLNEQEERSNPIRSTFAPTNAVRAVALASLAALAMGSVCLPGGNNPNNVGAGAFAATGTVLGLRVGDGATALLPGMSQALFVDEISVATGAVVKTVAIPNTGTTLGKNLACTLATGMFAAPFWDFGATPFNPNFAGVAATATSPALPAYSAAYGPSAAGYTQRQGLTFNTANPAAGWGVQGPFPVGSVRAFGAQSARVSAARERGHVSYPLSLARALPLARAHSPPPAAPPPPPAFRLPPRPTVPALVL